MAPIGASLLQSIGNVLHLPPNPQTFREKTQNGLSQELLIKRFEDALTTRITSLIPQDESRALTTNWLIDAVQVSLATNLDAQSFIPDVRTPLSNADEMWISNYLDYSLNILSMCNKIRESVAGIDRILMPVKVVLHYVNSQTTPASKKFCYIKDAVVECSMALKNYGEISCTDLERNSKNGHYLIKDRQKLHLHTKAEHVMRKQAFLVALYAAQATTSVICSLTVAAFTKAGGYLTEQPLIGTFAWSFSLVSLQETINAVARKRINQGVNFIIPELCHLELCLTKFMALLDCRGSNATLDLTNDFKGEIFDLVNNLDHQSGVLEKSLRALEDEVDRLFCLTMSNRNALLDKLKA